MITCLIAVLLDQTGKQGRKGGGGSLREVLLFHKHPAQSSLSFSFSLIHAPTSSPKPFPVILHAHPTLCVCVFFFLVVVTDAHEGLYIYHVLEFNSECHLKRGKQNTLQCLGHFHVY